MITNVPVYCVPKLSQNFEVYSFKKEKKIAIDIFSCIYLISLIVFSRTYVHICKYKFTSKEEGFEDINT